MVLVGLGAILAGLLIVGGGAIYNMDNAIRYSDELFSGVLPDMHNTMLLQLFLSQAAMPPNDHLIQETPSERADYRKLIRRVEKQFNYTLSLSTFTAKQTNIILQSRREWDRAYQTGKALLTLPGGSKTPHAFKLMLKYDAEVNTAINTLMTLHNLFVKEALRQNSKAHAIVKKNTQFVVVFSLAGLVIILLGAYFFLNRLFCSLRLLQHSINTFSKKEFDYEIPTDIPFEFAQIATGLNKMAKQLGENYQQLLLFSYRDSLTGCLNKRKFDEDIQHEIDRSRRFKHSFTLLLLDLDLFKQVNDTYGHLNGDAVLKQLVDFLNKEIRSPDTLYRYGGEEFVFLQPQTSDASARIAAERIRRNISMAMFQTSDNQNIQITVSIGYATYPKDGEDPDRLFTIADEGLYLAKQSGRNSVRHI